MLRKKSLEEKINTWFDSDLDIEIRVRKKNEPYKKNNMLVLRSNVEYRKNGIERVGGDRREIDMPMESNDDIYDNIIDFCGIFLTKDELISTLRNIENRGYYLN